MLVDNPANSLVHHDFTDLSDFFNTDLFMTSSQSTSSSSSSPSSTHHGLLTPPQGAPPTSFHDMQDGLPSNYSLFDDDLKLADPLATGPYDFSSAGTSFDHPLVGYNMPIDSVALGTLGGFNMNLGADMGLNLPLTSIREDPSQSMSIDPQLVDTPSSFTPASDFDDEEVSHDGDDEQSPQSTSSKHSNTASASSANSAPSAKATSPAASTDKEEGRERLTLTLTPAKVGGNGKSRRGAVISGGISKKIPGPLVRRDKENTVTVPSAWSAAPVSTTLTTAPPAPASTASANTSGNLPKPPAILKSSNAKKGKEKSYVEEEEDDVPQDWRPSPEVFAKMTSKEKRQLRNKISARNFRVRRKEYISTLEGDIAERDRLLEAVRTELGSTQSENLALKQEIAALKKILLDRGTTDLPSLNLPPPAPLPVGLGAVTNASTNAATSTHTSGESMVPSPPTTPTPHHQTVATASTSNNSPNLFVPNTQKDLPSSPLPRNSGGFWGGQHQPLVGMGGMGGGITPVHTALMPELNVGLWAWGLGGIASGTSAGPKKVLGDSSGVNINPLLNVIAAAVPERSELEKKQEQNENEKMSDKLGGFEAFADANLFTMKSLDAYRMQLWGKMAAQRHAQEQYLRQHRTQQNASQVNPNSLPLSGHAAAIRPHFFTSPSVSPKAVASSSTGLGGTLSAILSGKHSPSSNLTSTGLLTPPSSPKLGAQKRQAAPQQQQQQREQAQAEMLAFVASQTLFKKLGSAFWDAFSGSSSTSIAPSSAKNWDPEKVRKVLEGRAVVKVVDVDPTPSASSATAAHQHVQMGDLNGSASGCRKGTCKEKRHCVGELLEESMRSLTLGKGRH